MSSCPTLTLVRLLLHTKCFLDLCTFSLICSARGYIFHTLSANKYMYHANKLHSDISLLHVSRTQERERTSEDVTIELQKWHPTPHSNVNGSDYNDVAPMDTM